MHRLLLTAFILISVTSACFGQDIFSSCKEGTKQATEDFNKGIMKATSYGLIVFEDFDFEVFYDKYLFDKYEIKSSLSGCIVTEFQDCYSSKMIELIEEKYGDSFFADTRKEAKKLYTSQKRTENNLKKPIR